jgi:hypothetical protein
LTLQALEASEWGEKSCLAEIYIARARTLLEARRYEEAIAATDEILELEGEACEAYLLKG